VLAELGARWVFTKLVTGRWFGHRGYTVSRSFARVRHQGPRGWGII
jgi:hypothetical protein